MNRMAMICAVLVVAVLVLGPVPSDAVTIPSLPGNVPNAAAVAKYMPKDATAVLAFNVARLAEAGLIDKIEELAGEDAFEDLEELEIDLEKDISQVMVGVIVDPDEDEPEIYMAMAGDVLSEKKFLELYEEQEGEKPKAKTIAGKNVYDIEGEVDVCFLPGVMLFVPTEDSEADIAKMLAGEAGGFLANIELVSLMKDVNTKASIWGIAAFSKKLREAMGEDAEDAPFDVSALKTIAGSFDYADKVALDVELAFANNDAPAALVEMINTQVKGMAEQMAEMMPDLAKLMNALNAKADGKTATIQLAMDREAFEAAIESVFGMMFGGMVGAMEEGDWEEEEIEEEEEW